MLRKDLADALDISSSLVTRYVRRGMPCDDIEAARTWCKRTLDPARTKRGRIDRNPGGRRSQPERPFIEALDVALAMAMFADCHGIDRFGAILPHGVSILSDENVRLLWDDPSFPKGVRERWDEICAEWSALQSIG